MRKILLMALLSVATVMMAEVRVEDFSSEGGTTATYVTEVTSRTCSQATWTFLQGGILNGVGNFSTTAAVLRVKKNTETEKSYFMSDSISGGIDSLWLTYNSNGGESGNWNIKFYINDVEVGALTEAASGMDATPSKTFGIGNLQTTGKFVLKIVNDCDYSGSKNKFRFVFDDLSWTTYAAAGEKSYPNLSFENTSMLKNIEDDAFTNTFTCNSDATPVYSSSDEMVATVDESGLVTIVGVGNATIQAMVAETETYYADSLSYDLRVVPSNFHMETFDGAANITEGTGAYLSEPTAGTPSTATGITWTTYLGSVRDGFGSWPASNIAAAIRAKKADTEEQGYLISDSIAGGIDSLAFEWNSNGNEASRLNPWDIQIYVNDVMVGNITDACQAKQDYGNEFHFGVGNIGQEGKFVLKVLNNNVADASGSNHYRFVIDNIEWYSYEKGEATGVEQPNPDPSLKGREKVLREGQLLIIYNGRAYNAVGQEVK